MKEHRPEQPTTNGFHKTPDLDARVTVTDSSGIERHFWDSQIVDFVDYPTINEEGNPRGIEIELKRGHRIALDGIRTISVGEPI